MSFQLALDYLDAIEDTADPEIAAKFAEAAATFGGGPTSERAKEAVQACAIAAAAKSREVDLPPPHGPDDYGVETTPQDDEDVLRAATQSRLDRVQGKTIRAIR